MISSIPGNGVAWVFAGPFAVVTTTAMQRLTGVGEAPLGLAAGTQTARVDLCFQNNAVPGILTNFSGGSYSLHQFAAVRAAYPAVGSVVPGAGTWRVGTCVFNSGVNALSNNDYGNGWVQVTN